MRIASAACLVALTALLAGCGGGSSTTTATTDTSASGTSVGVSASTCSKLTYGGSGSPDAVIVSDLPMQGDSANRSSQQVEAIKVALDQAGWKAGDLNVGFQA